MKVSVRQLSYRSYETDRVNLKIEELAGAKFSYHSPRLLLTPEKFAELICWRDANDITNNIKSLNPRMVKEPKRAGIKIKYSAEGAALKVKQLGKLPNVILMLDNTCYIRCNSAQDGLDIFQEIDPLCQLILSVKPWFELGDN